MAGDGIVGGLGCQVYDGVGAYSNHPYSGGVAGGIRFGRIC
jgi:hypothetical protein